MWKAGDQHISPVTGDRSVMDAGSQDTQNQVSIIEGEIVHFSDATPTDAPQLVRLINAAYRSLGSVPGWTDERNLLDGPRIGTEEVLSQMGGGPFLLLRPAATGSISACIHISRVGEIAWYLSLLAVDPLEQATGLGASLLHEVEQQAVRAGTTVLRMTVIRQREALISWYERRGYRRTGETVPFPFGDQRVGRPLRDDLQLLVLEKVVRSD